MHYSNSEIQGDKSTIDEIINEHELSHRLYPRPRSICEECKGDIVLRWGPLKRPHWEHMTKSNCSTSSPGESATHKLAKEYLINFLTNSGYIYFQNTLRTM